MPVAAAHDLEDPRAGPGDNRLHFSPLIACIGDDALQKGKAPARFSQQRLGPIPVLYMSRMQGDDQQQSKRVGQDVALAAQDLLARVIAGRVKRAPPFESALCRLAVEDRGPGLVRQQADPKWACPRKAPRGELQVEGRKAPRSS